MCTSHRTEFLATFFHLMPELEPFWTKQLHSLALVAEGSLNGSFSAAGQGTGVW
ncbi:hypothetical protein DV515_00008496 [Chloebia gouldiae]|uniref:Uncharacterized protein n=1 Tax=Chloebia gouldiae TaxID=44316 RepID=A0A3L8SEI1_CHLGU|nr:hypothetical protein DV515_00008496 [Chloebia gouldiae]